MKTGDIVFVKARVEYLQEKTVVVKILNGFGEPEVRMIDSNVMTKKIAREMLQS